MWGYKRCGAYRANPNGLPYKGFPSSGIHDTMNAAAAFSIISIFMTLVATISTILLVFKCISKMIPGVLSIVAFLTTLIVWACQAGVYHRNYDVVTAGGVRLQADIRSGFNYAGSFGLFVTAWCLQTIVMVLVFFA
ncbi:G-amastin [Leptomonas seymouri]|uniref:G-amastin n=1 Tax=Leptomonas seymouri TaxID=5684 RepID=A0A0N1I0E5_LEPSE|nr:G-amastin [Leptomonas seymouri]|eukprot:KPI82414.1 G-amastin [Leptomonas seymouri]